MAATLKEPKAKTIQCTVRREDLAVGLNLCASAVGRRIYRIYKPILGCCKISKDGRGLRLDATNLEVHISYKIDQADCDEWEDIAAPCDRLSAIVRGMSGDTLRLAIEGEHLRISDDKSTFKLFTQDAKDMPPRPELAGSEITLAGSELARIVRQTQFAVDDSVGIFNGTLFDASKSGLSVCATEKHKLASTKIPCKAEVARAVVPSSTMKLAAKAVEGFDDDVTIHIEENRAGFSIDGAEISSLVIEGTFPPYECYFDFPAVVARINIPKDELLAAVRHASILLNEFDSYLIFKFESKGVRISAAVAGCGECDISVPYKSDMGKEMVVGMNAKYLREIVQACEAETIKILLISPKRPVMIEDGKSTFLLVPVNLEN